MQESKKITYIWDELIIKECDRIPAVLGRASMVHSLIRAYDLLDEVQIYKSQPASYEDLRLFHSEIYLDHLKTIVEVDDEYSITETDEEYGIGYDCTPVSDMYKLVTTIAGGSIVAAKLLMYGVCDVAINWFGGWHHAQRFGAEGFCYINDIVIAIEKLKHKYGKVLYIDLDVHHGNGVQDAYNLSKKVFTLSIHKYEPGFYPGSGGIEDIGTFIAKGYSCNIPLHASYTDNTFVYVFERVFASVYSHFNPDAVVLQCGADALALDPHGGANLTERGYCQCVRTVLAKQVPTLVLGGGGYNHANTARLWTSITAAIVGKDLEEDIPDNKHFTQYGPDYTLPVQASLARDQNTRMYLDDCIDRICGNIHKYVRHEESGTSQHSDITVPESSDQKLVQIHAKNTQFNDLLKKKKTETNSVLIKNNQTDLELPRVKKIRFQIEEDIV